MARIAIIEDDEAIRSALSEMLQKNGHEAVVVASFERVVDATLEANPDLVLLDLNLPGLDGTVVCREIRSRSSVPIIVVTSRTGEIDEVMCMTLGADDFIAKPYSSHVLLVRIEALLRRVGGMAATTMSHNGLTLDVSRSTVTANGRTVELTKNELRILSLLMRSAGAIVPRETIMVELWDSDAFVDDNTLTVNINRLRQTLARLGVNDYLVTHRGQGYSV
mgnify:FL=1